MSKIITFLSGGLGNQLFQYAAARRLSLVTNSELVLNCVSGFKRDFFFKRRYELDHFNIAGRSANYFERLEPFPRIQNYIRCKWNSKLELEERNYIQQERIEFDPRILNIKISGNLFFKGYWQSEKYFSDHVDQIRDDLQFIPPSDLANRRMVDLICNKNSVAVHVRRFNTAYSNSQKWNWTNVSTDYYKNALSTMDSMVDFPHYFIFSDSPSEVAKVINLPSTRTTIVDVNHSSDMAYADLWLMSHCKNFIIANSTFSWWGAWLSMNKSKIVITPGFEQLNGNGWGFPGLLPDSWLKL